MAQHDVAVVMHIDEDLSDEQIHNLERDLSFSSGVKSACVHERTRHLMVIDYNPAKADSSELLANVQRKGLHAELIGL